ncbi:MAG: type II/IV secretion system protein [Candidatus Riflebacteria bacterium]|nr:type II/IV secretion system protein [Candidatus Riflebacteria bacterium]
MEDNDLVGRAGSPEQLLLEFITAAVHQGASAVHVEPSGEQRLEEVRVRLRREGVLVHHRTLPREMLPGLLSAVKRMAALDETEHRLPQDGRSLITVALPATAGAGERVVELRISVVPVLWGEQFVVRWIDASPRTRPLADLGLDGVSLLRLDARLKNPSGLVLVSGPSGSGKTTTLYSMLGSLDHEGRKICTAEEPVEHALRGITQVPCRPELGLTLAAATRSLLRQDPDVLLVGQTQDYETAELALKIALGGRLVLSSVHANDAAAVFGRFIDLGLEPALVVDGVTAIVAQRLVRKVCLECRVLEDLADEDRVHLAITTALLRSIGMPELGEAPLRVPRPVGCPACGGSGYRGRTGLFEVLAVSPAIRRVIMNGGSCAELTGVARAEGMITLRQAGVRQALQGVTTLTECLRVTAPDQG